MMYLWRIKYPGILPIEVLANSATAALHLVRKQLIKLNLPIGITPEIQQIG